MKNNLENKIYHQKIIQDYVSREHFLQSPIWKEVKRRLGNEVEMLGETTPHRLSTSRKTPPFEREVNNSVLGQSKPLSARTLPLPKNSRFVGTQQDKFPPMKDELQVVLKKVNTEILTWMQFTNVKLFDTKVGYLPRVDISNLDFNNLVNIAKKFNSAYVTVDPVNIESVKGLVDEEDIEVKNDNDLPDFNIASLKHLIISKAKPIHLKNNIVIFADQTDEKLLSGMKVKYRYNVRLAAKNNTITKFGNTENDYNDFMEVYLDTKKRQNYHGRDKNYLNIVWKTLGEFEKLDNKIHRMIVKTYMKDELVSAMFLFCYDGVVYYPYGGSYEKHRNLKPTYFQIFETLKWARQNNFKYFDFWGIDEEFDANDGFSSFKMGFGGYKVTYVDSFDIIINPIKRKLIKLAEFIKKKL
jgi:lipid II:glycine glycyltransferase (peptidoglycan interpeptide bridge formation enzyme)